MKYFLHDTSAFQDEKITELYIKFGYTGIGLFFIMLEKMALQEKPIKTEILKKQLQINKKLQKIWSFMEEIGLICSANGDTFNKNLLNNLKIQLKQKENNKLRVEKWREKQRVTENVTDNVTVTEQLRNAAVTPAHNITVHNSTEQYKTKKDKDLFFKENTKEKFSSLYEIPGFEEKFEEWLAYRKSIKKPIKDPSLGYQLISLDKLREGGSNPIKIIEQSITRGWTGFFKLQDFNSDKKTKSEILLEKTRIFMGEQND